MTVNHQHDTRTWKQRWLPHPFLSLGLVYIWSALIDSFQVGSLLMGAILGVLIPIATRSIWDNKPKFTSLGLMVLFSLILLWDIVTANLQVAWIVLFRPVEQLRPQWFTVPLDLQSREAIAVLASAITLTPGTVSCDLSANGRSLLIHAMDTSDTEAEVKKIKQRYEAKLLRIFE